MIRRPPGWWDRWFLGLARYVATASKDPSTQVGAVIADPDRRVVSVGFSGLPRGVCDTAERLQVREIKYALIVHAERNALLFARGSLAGCTLYTWPLSPCAPCASMVIQVGITAVVSPSPTPALAERWGADTNLAASLFTEAGVLQLVLSCDG